jgi:thiamine kinase-like enzyme
MNIPDYVEEILAKNLGSKGWSINKPSHGLSKESYIASNNIHKVFIKFDVNIKPLKRVCDLNLAPQLLSSGEYNKRTYIIQEFIEGKFPDRSWFTSNLIDLATFINKYHSDNTLFEILKKNSKLDYFSNVSDSLLFIEHDLGNIKDEASSDFERYLSQLRDKSSELSTVEVVPTHADPNYKNFLLTKNKIYMIDWDDVRLSDPIRDIAPLLWWYVNKKKWPILFNKLDMPINDTLMNRFYWWMARQSLTIAIFFAKRHDIQQTQYYLEDFSAALNQENNPHF